MENNSLGVEETDAVHHRLAGESPGVEKNFQCYDCNQSFFSVADLGEHSQSYLWHSVEMCLRCWSPVTVFIQKYPARVIHLHSCKNPLSQYENSDLHLLSVQISNLLSWTILKHHQGMIMCDVCDEVFSQTLSGLFDFFQHSSNTTHNLILSSKCRKCGMPDFKLQCTNNECFIAHFCTKDSKSVLKEVPKET